MSVQLMQQGRPPFVRFEQRTEEDRDATIAAGHLVQRDVDFVLILTAGSKDTLEKPAKDWLANCKLLAQKGKWPKEWIDAHSKMYEDFKAGLEVTPLGFSVRQWGGISKAQAENLIMIGVYTVEDLAAANEQTLARIGMGGRFLKEKAQAWMDANKGNAGEELAALRAELNTAVQTISTMQGKIKELEADKEGKTLSLKR